jgi:NAD(P)-dependent dehydrogenase (short-subunit alcohol dehydrogenase family)
VTGGNAGIGYWISERLADDLWQQSEDLLDLELRL